MVESSHGINMLSSAVDSQSPRTFAKGYRGNPWRVETVGCADLTMQEQ